MNKRMHKSFALMGVAGYIAPRHLAAIKETGNELVAAHDPNDSVGILDSYFPEARFFTVFERFDRYLEKLKRINCPIDYLSICSPNHLHDSQMRYGLRIGSDVICEKPLVLNPWNIDALQQLEQETGKRVNTILQLRLHPSILDLKKTIERSPDDTKFDLDLTYITSRGSWYLQSWKGNEQQSGGIATNIGVHFFDMLHFVFGKLVENFVHLNTPTKAAGYLEYANARVRWYLSIDAGDLPQTIVRKDHRTYRALNINGEDFEFSDGFFDLHEKSYENILLGKGFGLSETRQSIETVSAIRNMVPKKTGDLHPFLVK